MKKWLHAFLTAALKSIAPKPDLITPLREEVSALKRIISQQSPQPEGETQRRYMAMLADLAEAKQMAGAGPWTVSPETMRSTESILSEAAQKLGLRETQADGSIGATGDINLMLNTVQWRRDLQLSFLEFSRWGIQQIILICRLYWLKNPIMRRLINVCAAYVFARGVEVTTNNDAANEVWKDFVERNKRIFGQIALVDSERKKHTDGNLFWCFFADKADRGKVDCRMIDATEMQEVLTNPEDRTDPWYYRRMWTQQAFDEQYGMRPVDMECWYPALYFEPENKPTAIRGKPVMWESPVYHRKCGYVGAWLFGCPESFPMVDWAREARLLLEACASIKQSLMQFALIVTTKGGQQAMSGVKQQMGTTVGPNTNLWDQNPPAVSGATFVSGTGTELKAFDSSKGGGNPDDVRQFKLMCCMVAGVPESFLSDISTGNLATATSLDRPTETVFLEKQEAWREDLTTICKYVLEVSAGAPSGMLRESLRDSAAIQILECRRHIGPRGEVIYEAYLKDPAKLEIRVNFPAIREGDQKARIDGIVAAMTLGNKAGQIIGIDEKVGVRELYNAAEIEGGTEMAEDQYPEGEYTMDRTKEVLPPPIKKPMPAAGGVPQIDPQTGLPTDPAPPERDEVQEALQRVHEATGRVSRRWNPPGR